MKSNQLYFFPLYQNFKTRKNGGKRKKVFFILKGLLLIYCVCVRKQLTLDKNETNWKMFFFCFSFTMGTDGDYSFHRKPLLSKSIKLIKKWLITLSKLPMVSKTTSPVKGAKVLGDERIE
jgi:hypothetical protein